jgi:2,3-bisphosphoglycerate-dependent phosphoglycerate mutase
VTRTLVYLFRHGEPVLAETRRFIGHLDVPLSPRGEAQCVAQSARLRDVPLAALYSSDLERARRSGELLGAPSAGRRSWCPRSARWRWDAGKG